MYQNEFKRMRVESLQESVRRDGHLFSLNYKMHYGRFVRDDQIVIVDNIREANSSTSAKAFAQAGPREYIPWKTGEVRAAIVTCGGLCPGLNNVIQEIFFSLHYNYGVDTIYGIKSGYRGFWQKDYQPWLRLTPEYVRNIHELGGTVLGASRGGFDVTKIVNACEVYGINQLYIIGGDGTHRGGERIGREARARGMKMSVACIPKTIDNDIGIIDKSFGFDTAVAEARKAIASVVLEAQCAPNGIGIVKLMGRHAGYISAHATLASSQVDICLVPEVPFHLHGKNGLLNHVHRLLKNQKSAVIVVAEGAGADLLASNAEKDESGNAKLGDIGHFMARNIDLYFRSQNVPVSVKYVDPSYMIRSVPAAAEDAVFCLFLASHAVHGAMAGYTNFSVGLVTGRTVYMPIPVVVDASPSYLNPKGSTWERVLSMTHQPNWGDPTFVEIRDERDAEIERAMSELKQQSATPLDSADDVHQEEHEEERPHHPVSAHGPMPVKLDASMTADAAAATTTAGGGGSIAFAQARGTIAPSAATTTTASSSLSLSSSSSSSTAYPGFPGNRFHLSAL